MKEQKATQQRRSYDAEFKSNVLQMHSDGRSVPSLADSFGISENLIYRWKSESKRPGATAKPGEPAEVWQLRKQLKEVEQERDILKKALGIFSRLP